jgi:Transposase IS200 like
MDRVPTGTEEICIHLPVSLFIASGARKSASHFLSSDVRNRLWPYLGGIARENKMKALAIGGVADHVHMLDFVAANTLSVQSFAASQGQFLQMDS